MDRSVVERLLEAHGVSDRVERCERLEAGYSDDEKWVVWVEGEPAYLLRLSAIEMLPRRRSEFEAVLGHYERGVLCPRPLAFGETPDWTRCFTLLEYIVGESADKALPNLPIGRQIAQLGQVRTRELQRVCRKAGERLARDQLGVERRREE